jgi:transposase-like protein
VTAPLGLGFLSGTRTSVRVMEKDTLEEYLSQGLSLDRIGALVGKDGSTIGYWVDKHGLEPVHRTRHVARGGIERQVLERLLARGLSMRAMSRELTVSLATVRHWMRKYGLTATAYVRSSGSAAEKPRSIRRWCRAHGETTFVLRGSGYRCKRCNSERVSARRRKVKRILMTEAGGGCALCGYDRCPALFNSTISTRRPSHSN